MAKKHKVSVLLDDEEYETVKNYADKEGYSFAFAIRKLLKKIITLGLLK